MLTQISLMPASRRCFGGAHRALCLPRPCVPNTELCVPSKHARHVAALPLIPSVVADSPPLRICATGQPIPFGAASMSFTVPENKLSLFLSLSLSLSLFPLRLIARPSPPRDSVLCRFSVRFSARASRRARRGYRQTHVRDPSRQLCLLATRIQWPTDSTPTGSAAAFLLFFPLFSFQVHPRVSSALLSSRLNATARCFDRLENLDVVAWMLRNCVFFSFKVRKTKGIDVEACREASMEGLGDCYRCVPTKIRVSCSWF